MSRVAHSISLAAIALAAFASCKKEEKPEEEATPAAAEPAAAPAPVPTASPLTEARQIFKKRCIVCHGESGKGDGPGAAALNPKPRDYTSAEWQTSVTDEELKKVIIGGGASVGKSPVMPPNPDLKNKPEVVDGLVTIIRGFKGS